MLGRFKNVYVDVFKTSMEEDTDEKVLFTQNSSEQYYRQIWASLSHDEQLVLYDLAEEGLVNTTNHFAILNLMNKGLIIEKPGSCILIPASMSFKNFILTAVNSREMKSIEKDEANGQSWSDYKYPVLIILAALVYFVLSSNPEKFGNVLPFITGIMAGIPTILKLLSYLKPEPKP